MLLHSSWRWMRCLKKVKGDSQSCRLTRWLHCLLVRGCWPAPGKREWLADGWCHLRNLWHRRLPTQSGPQLCSPPNGRSVSQGYNWPLGREASRGGMLQMESPGRGVMYSDISPKEVLGVVTPPEEAVTPYPGVCYAIWLHDVGGAD